MIEELMNAILVHEGIRPAMLIQPVDYNETTAKDPVTKDILRTIQRHFPELKQSESAKDLPGILVSPTVLDIRSIVADEDMGRVLGYPCYAQFSEIDRDNSISYYIDVDATTADGKSHSLFSNVCQDESKLTEFAAIARRAEFALNDRKYEALLGPGRKTVRVKSIPNIPTKFLIAKLLSEEEISSVERNAIQNILFNFGFSKEFQRRFFDLFQFGNPTHRGLLLSLLLNERNDLLSPFYPLQLHPVEYEQVQTIVGRWERGIQHILESTRVPVRGGRKASKTVKALPKKSCSTRKH